MRGFSVLSISAIAIATIIKIPTLAVFVAPLAFLFVVMIFWLDVEYKQ